MLESGGGRRRGDIRVNDLRLVESLEWGGLTLDSHRL